MPAYPVWRSDPRYNLLRSYVSAITVRDSANALYWSSDGLHWHIGVYHVMMPIDTRFYPWSSNYYTLDHVFDFANARLWIAWNEYPSPFGVFAWADFRKDAFGLAPMISLFTPTSEYHDAPLPPAPANYWLNVADP